MSLQRPPSYGPRITILGIVLALLLGVGLNADALFGAVPEAETGEGEVAGAPTMNDGTDFDMETQVAEIMLGKATETLLSQAVDGLPELADGWSPDELPRSHVDDGYVEDEDEAEYYDDLDPLNTVMKVSNDKERAALAKLFEKKPADEPAPAAEAAPPATKAEKAKSKPLAMRPNAAVITKRKPQTAPRQGRAKAPVARATTTSKTSAPPAPPKETPEAPPVAEEPAQPEEPEGPAIDPNASAKELIAQGRKLLLSGSPASAEKAYRLALTKKAGSARARYGLAKALYQRNRATEAIAELRKILSANQNHGSALLMMGSLLQEQGQTGQAKSHYQRYLDARPNGRRADEVRSILGRL